MSGRHEDSNAPSLSELEADERELERAFKRGFDAGVEHQKTASPPPKTKHLAAQLASERAAWARKKAAFLESARASISHCRRECTAESYCGQCEPLLTALAALGDDHG